MFLSIREIGMVFLGGSAHAKSLADFTLFKKTDMPSLMGEEMMLARKCFMMLIYPQQQNIQTDELLKGSRPA